MSTEPTGFPINEDNFDGGAGISKGQTAGGDVPLVRLLNNLYDWIAVRGIVETPADLPASAEDGWMYAVREVTGPGTPPGLFIYDGDTSTWENLLNTGLPANHAATHETGGPDEVSIQGLLGTPAFPLGSTILTVGPVGSGCQFTSITTALAHADTLPPGPIGILLNPAYYDEDVVLRHNDIHFTGIAGGLGGVVIKSMCVSDCTLASIDAFRLNSSPDKGDFSKLVRDATIHSVPRVVTFTNVRFHRRTNSPAWFAGTDGVWDPWNGLGGGAKYNHDSALYSFMALGAAVPSTQFLDDVCALITCVTDTAVGSVPDAPNGHLFVRAGNPVYLGGVAGDGAQLHNSGGCMMFGGVGGFGACVSFYDDTEPEPNASPRQGFALIGCDMLGGLFAIGKDGNNAMALRCLFGGWKTEATVVGPGTAATHAYCGNMGAFEITNVGPTLLGLMPRYLVPIAGAGAAGYTEVVGFGT